MGLKEKTTRTFQVSQPGPGNVHTVTAWITNRYYVDGEARTLELKLVHGVAVFDSTAQLRLFAKDLVLCADELDEGWTRE